MREIKFRAWDGEKMRRSDYFDQERGIWHNDDETPFKDSEGAFPDEVIEITKSHYGWIWMQYTGLKDTRDDDIYESDIVTCVHGDTWEVQWSDEDAAFLLHKEPLQQAWLGEHVEDGVTIIGNIYESPQLLAK